MFKSYSHSGGYASDITVNLKDLKALVGLCVEMGADVCLRFDAPGVPLLAVPHIRGVQVKPAPHTVAAWLRAIIHDLDRQQDGQCCSMSMLHRRQPLVTLLSVPDLCRKVWFPWKVEKHRCKGHSIYLAVLVFTMLKIVSCVHAFRRWTTQLS